MSKLVKRIISSLMLVIVLFAGTDVSVSAETTHNYREDIVSSETNLGNSVLALSVSTNYVINKFSISEDGVAVIELTVNGKKAITKISATVTLQKYNESTNAWNKINQWNYSSNTKLLQMKKTCYLSKKGKYRVFFTVDVWSGETKETLCRTIIRTY